MHFNDITTSRSLWYMLFCKHVLEKGLPIPLGNRSIDSLLSAELEHCTRRALRLHSAWTSLSPPFLRESRISPVPNSKSRNIALQYLPGRDQRWLLSVTAVTTERTTWFAIQCWNVDSRTPVCVAKLATASLSSYAINSDPDTQAVLAILVPQSVPPFSF